MPRNYCGSDWSQKSIAMTGATDVEGVHLEWDAAEDVRETIRDGKNILEKACQDISTCNTNASLLGPLLQKMSERENRDLPGIDQLKDELEQLLKKNKQGLDLEFADISKKAWTLKKLCGFVKAKCRRREVSTVSRLQCVVSFNPRIFNKHVLIIVLPL